MDYQISRTTQLRLARSARALTSALSLLALFLLAASPAVGASINYGDFFGTSVDYFDVTESSSTDPVPLYGPPTLLGNTLDFDPAAFGANAAGGGADVTDGQINYRMMGAPGAPLTSIFIGEGGDYTLVGSPPASVGYGIAARVTVTEIDGVSVSAPNQFDLFKSDSDGKTLPGDAGVTLPWDFSLDFNLGAALVLQEGFTYNPLGPEYVDGGDFFKSGVTKAEVVINDTLFAISSPGSVAFIAKKNFLINTDTDPLNPMDIPEPATAVLALFACSVLALKRR